MSDIDDRILAALDQDDREQLERYGEEPGLWGLVGESFKGRLRVIVWIVFALILVFLALVVYSAWQFFSTDVIASKLDWLAIGLASLLVFGLLRLWYFMELNRLSVIREVKRLELQVSLLAKKISRESDTR